MFYSTLPILGHAVQRSAGLDFSSSNRLGGETTGKTCREAVGHRNSNLRVTLIEDNLSLARGIENALRDQGYAVDHLDDGRAGDEFLRTAGCDVAIIDVNLPNMTGIEIIRALRTRGDATPVLILTAMGKTSDRVAGLDAGADDYLVKPFEMA